MISGIIYSTQGGKIISSDYTSDSLAVGNHLIDLSTLAASVSWELISCTTVFDMGT